MMRATSVLLLVLATVGAWGQADPDKFIDGRIEFLIHMPDGQPALNAEVQVVPRLDGTPRVDSLKPSEYKATGQDGRVVFEGLGPGQYKIRVVHEAGGAWGSASLNRDEKQLKQTLQLKAFGSLSGVALDAEGNPVQAAVLVADRSMPLWTTCDEGRFHVDGFDPSAVNELALVRPDYSWQEVEDYRNSDYVEVLMPPGTAIDGTLVFDNGQPAPGVTLYYKGSTPVLTDAQGKFRTWPLPPGSTVDVYGWYNADGKKFHAEKQIVLAEGPVQPEVVELKPFLEVGVRGTVKRKDTGEAVRARLLVDSTFEFAFPDEKGRTDADGRFEIKDLPPQRLWITAEPVDPRLYTLEDLVEVDLSQGKPVSDLSFTVDEGSAIKGIVLDEAGNPIQAQILVSTSPRYRAFRTNQAGRFTLGNLATSDTKLTLSVHPNDAEGTTLEVGPIAKGEMLTDIEVRVGAKKPEGLIRGKVVDAQGTPLQKVEILPQPFEGFSPGISDAAGAFEISFKEPGEHKFQVYVVDSYGPPGHQQRLFRKFRFVEGETINVEAGVTYDHRIVLDAEPLRALIGRVTDEQGKPVQASLNVLGPQAASFHRMGEGWFALDNLPEEPFLVEVTAPGYQARILLSGRDFKVPALDMALTLKAGPFPEGVPVMQTVTGYTPAEIAGGALGTQGNLNERRYVQLAKAPAEQPPPDPSTAPATQQGARQLVVTDSQDRPVPRVYIEDAAAYDVNGPVTAEMAIPRGPKRLLESADGRYSVDRLWFPGFYVSAEGTAAVFVPHGHQPPPPDEPVAVMLHPASKVKLRVTDYEGRPVAKVPVGPAGYGYRFLSTNYHSLPRTDSNGTVTFDRLLPGTYSYSAYTPSQTPGQLTRSEYEPTVTVAVEPGREHEATIKYGTPAEGTPEGILQTWREALTTENRFQDMPKDLPPAPEGKMRAKVAQLVVDGLNNLPGLQSHEEKEAQFLSRTAQAMGLEEAVPALEDLLRRWKSDVAGVVVADVGTQGVTFALAVLAGNDAIDTFVAVAADDTAPYYARRDALIGLGKVGTPEAVAAYQKLRDAAYGKPGAPEHRESYTHAERMAEAVEMVFEVIPGKSGSSNESLKPSLTSAWVSEDMSTGKISYNGFAESWEIELKRFGGEWLVTGIGSITMA